MKKTLLILSFLTFSFTQAQIVNIPDANFKNALLSANSSNQKAKDLNGNWTVIDTNYDGEIQNSEAENISYLDVNFKHISDLTGIAAFTYLNELFCYENQLSTLDVSNNTNLTRLYCDDNQLSTLDVSLNTNLNYLGCSENQLSTLDVSQNTNLTQLFCYHNQLSALDVSNNMNLTELYCGYNQLSTLNVSTNTNLTQLSCGGNQLSTLDISNNTNLTGLYCEYNQLSTLNISTNTNLTQLSCDHNQLSILDVLNNTNLFWLYCYSNQLSNLNVSNNLNLTYLFCSSNQLNTLDVSNNLNLIKLKCNDNLNLEYINLNNGNNENFDIIHNSNFENLPNLQTVCVDELNTDLTAFIVTETGHSVTFTEYCSIEPAQSNIINGNTSIDLDLNGCDSNDISLNNILITADNGTESFGTFVLEDASYSMFTNEGNFTTSVTTNLPNYWSATPNTVTNTFTGFDNTFTADFCIAPNQTVNDVNISLVPTSQARPGFDTTYQIVYKNVGTTVLNGDVTLTFNDNQLSFLNASETVNSQTSNSLTFNYTNLNPFETRTIDLVFNVKASTVNVGDILNFTSAINPIAGDYTTDDNTFTLDQTVIGSYDPNDITCLEGDEVPFAEADKYLHYIIRFQNEGTADAINIVVKNVLDEKLDWSTLQLETASHQNRVAIKNGNEVEFIFEDIHLIDSTTDEPNSHGYIAYKIKPKSTVALNDIINNQADIFFDYNEAVITNIATTQFVNTLAVKDANLLAFTIYPTPTNNVLTVSSKTSVTKIEIYTKLGQLVLSNTNKNSIDVANLSQGLYFCKVTDEFGNSGIQKVIKK